MFFRFSFFTKLLKKISMLLWTGHETETGLRKTCQNLNQHHDKNRKCTKYVFLTGRFSSKSVDMWMKDESTTPWIIIQNVQKVDKYSTSNGVNSHSTVFPFCFKPEVSFFTMEMRPKWKHKVVQDRFMDKLINSGRKALTLCMWNVDILLLLKVFPSLGCVIKKQKTKRRLKSFYPDDLVSELLFPSRGIFLLSGGFKVLIKVWTSDPGTGPTGAGERSSLLEERKRMFVARQQDLGTSGVIKSLLCW